MLNPSDTDRLRLESACWHLESARRSSSKPRKHSNISVKAGLVNGSRLAGDTGAHCGRSSICEEFPTHTHTRTHYFPLSSDEMVECMVEFS